MKLTTDLIRRRAVPPAASNDKPYSWTVELPAFPATGDPAGMSASEQMFFLGAPLAHVVAYEQDLKQARLRASMPIPLARLS